MSHQLECADVRVIAFLVTSQVSSGATVGYLLWMPKVYALCLVLVVNARLSIGEQLKGGGLGESNGGHS